ncbi:hypothetical protein AGLY_001106 [Aphis glycines]|uniref:Uncharacterized protein n=1 Tax=Aphis glycines TaxID=307491 RepID=A0A6G0U9D7_APHGL|nr:hypothetical protein AGLY_001106 [Aphis glycines]
MTSGTYSSNFEPTFGFFLFLNISRSHSVPVCTNGIRLTQSHPIYLRSFKMLDNVLAYFSLIYFTFTLFIGYIIRIFTSKPYTRAKLVKWGMDEDNLRCDCGEQPGADPEGGLRPTQKIFTGSAPENSKTIEYRLSLNFPNTLHSIQCQTSTRVILKPQIERILLSLLIRVLSISHIDRHKCVYTIIQNQYLRWLLHLVLDEL